MGWAFLAVVLFATSAASGAGFDYQGRIFSADQPFSGEGQFCFAILDEAEKPLWTSGALPQQAEAKVPDDAVKLPVTNGVYHVRLGDTSTGQPALDEVEILTNPGCKLRIWFNDGTNGWHRAGQDVPLDGALREGRAKFISSDQAEKILRGLRELRMRLEQENARAAEVAEAVKQSAENPAPTKEPKARP